MTTNNGQQKQPTRDEVRDGAKEMLKDLLRKRRAATATTTPVTPSDDAQQATKPDAP